MPSNFVIREKHPKSRGNGLASVCVYFNDPSTGYECQRSGPSRLGANEYSIALTCTSAATAVCCVCGCARALVRARACVGDVFAIYYNNI